MGRTIEPIKQKIRRYRLKKGSRDIALGVGCAWFGRNSGEEEYDDGCEIESKNVELMHKIYETGFRYFDSSRQYGESEVAVGKFIKEIDRSTIFLATKAHYAFRTMPKEEAFELFKRHFYESFERLQTDHIDLYQIHDTDCYNVCAEKVIPFLQDRRDEGLIDYIGMGTRRIVSHCHAISSGTVESSLTYLDYNLLKLSATPLIEMARKLDTALINSSVLMFGLLKGPDPLAGGPYYGNDLVERQFAVKMQALCKKLDIDIIAAALQLSLLNPDIDITLNGIKRPSNLESTMRSLDTFIPPDSWAEIFALQRTLPNLYVQEEFIP